MSEKNEQDNLVSSHENQMVQDIPQGIGSSEELGDKAVVSKLIKIKKFWRCTSLASLFLFLTTIMYACGSVQQSNTVIADQTKTSESEGTSEPSDEPENGVESVTFYEYVIKPNESSPLSPEYTDDLLIQNDIGYCANPSIEAYGKSYYINWIAEKGDNNFTVNRKTSEEYFVSETSIDSISTCPILSDIHGEVLEYMPSDTYEALLTIVPHDCTTYGGGLGDEIAVILPESTTDKEIEQGVQSFLEKFQDLDYRLSGEQDVDYQYVPTLGQLWSILDKSPSDLADMLGESFKTEGFVISSEGDKIRFLDMDGKIAIESEHLKNGDKVIFLAKQIFNMNSDTTAAFYSKYIQGTGDIRIFDSHDGFNAYLDSVYGK